MADENKISGKGNRILGSLREALSAANRNEDHQHTVAKESSDAKAQTGTIKATPPDSPAPNSQTPPPLPLPSAAEAAREARGGTPNIPPVNDNLKPATPPTTGVLKQEDELIATAEPRTQLLRGRQTVQRGEFDQDPVVGWLVIVGGPGIGTYRPIFEGNNTIGRSTTNRIPIDFGDNAISGEEQAYIRYDSADRSFLLVPNMAKTNIVSVNNERPTSAVTLQSMDVITMGRTQLVFVPFCGPEFDWSELVKLKTEN